MRPRILKRSYRDDADFRSVAAQYREHLRATGLTDSDPLILYFAGGFFHDATLDSVTVDGLGWNVTLRLAAANIERAGDDGTFAYLSGSEMPIVACTFGHVAEFRIDHDARARGYWEYWESRDDCEDDEGFLVFMDDFEINTLSAEMERASRRFGCQFNSLIATSSEGAVLSLVFADLRVEAEGDVSLSEMLGDASYRLPIEKLEPREVP